MSRLSSPLFPLLLLLILPILTSAQEITSSSETMKAGDKQAFELLDTIAQEIPNLRAPRNRIYLTTAVADLLWTKDEKRARSLFETVTREIVSAMAAFDPSANERFNNFALIQQQRREIIDRMARHDAELALAFLRATRLPPTGESTHFRASETELEFHLAGMIAATDPAQALRLARNALHKGMSYGMVQILSQIDAKDREAARSLHSDIVDRLKNEDFSRNQEFANMAWDLLSSYQPPAANEATYRDLVEVLATAASLTPRDSAVVFVRNYYGQLQFAMPQIEKYAPSRAPLLRQLLQNVQRTQDPNTRMYQEMNELVSKGSVDDLMSLASKYEPQLATPIYEQASMKALSSGDPNRARQIVSEMITEPAQRRQMLSQIENQLVWNTAQENKIAEARRMLSRMKDVEQRVNVLMSMAMTTLSKGDKKQALELLAEAKPLIESSAQNPNKLQGQLQLAQNYASLDVKESTALLESVIVQVNQLVSAAAVLDGFENQYLSEGEWLKDNYSRLGNLINSLYRSLAFVANHDPASASYLSNQLERPEIRLMAQLEIAQSLLSGLWSTPGRRTMTKGLVPSVRQ